MLFILLVSISRQGPCLGLYTRWGDVSLGEKLWEQGQERKPLTETTHQGGQSCYIWTSWLIPGHNVLIIYCLSSNHNDLSFSQWIMCCD